MPRTMWQRKRINRRSKNRGKALEREVAKMFGGKRLGLLGDEDVEHPTFTIECKSRQQFSGRGWYDQAVRNAPKVKRGQKKKIAIVVIHEKKRPIRNSFVLINVKDFLKMVKICGY